MSLVTLTTDFGVGNYVAQVKGVLLSLNPTIRIVDVSHDVAPGDVREAAYLVETFVPAFPEASVHVVVVDPGVGSDRRAIAAYLAGRILVGPDNGVFTAFLDAAQEIREITNRDLFLPEVSSTFHGRDVFAPVAAHLAGGGDLATVGPPLEGDPIRVPDLLTEGEEGVVLSVDRFGNLITSFPSSLLEERPEATLAGPAATLGARHIFFSDAEPGVDFLYAGSGGRIEVARNGESAADALGWGRGTALRFAEAAE